MRDNLTSFKSVSPSTANRHKIYYRFICKLNIKKNKNLEKQYHGKISREKEIEREIDRMWMWFLFFISSPIWCYLLS